MFKNIKKAFTVEKIKNGKASLKTKRPDAQALANTMDGRYRLLVANRSLGLEASVWSNIALYKIYDIVTSDWNGKLANPYDITKNADELTTAKEKRLYLCKYLYDFDILNTAVDGSYSVTKASDEHPTLVMGNISKHTFAMNVISYLILHQVSEEFEQNVNLIIDAIKNRVKSHIDAYVEKISDEDISRYIDNMHYLTRDCTEYSAIDEMCYNYEPATEGTYKPTKLSIITDFSKELNLPIYTYFTDTTTFLMLLFNDQDEHRNDEVDVLNNIYFSKSKGADKILATASAKSIEMYIGKYVFGPYGEVCVNDIELSKLKNKYIGDGKEKQYKLYVGYKDTSETVSPFSKSPFCLDNFACLSDNVNPTINLMTFLDEKYYELYRDGWIYTEALTRQLISKDEDDKRIYDEIMQARQFAFEIKKHVAQALM